MSRLGRLGVTFVVLATAFVSLNAVFIWFPRTDSPAKADVVFFIAGTNEGARLHEAIGLVQDGYAPLLVTDDSGIRDHHHCRTAVPTVCFKPDPNTTQGEARVAAAMAAKNGWKTILLVLSKDQATRARVRFRRCYDGGLRVIAVPIGADKLHTTLYQDAAMIKAETVQRGC